MRARACWSVVVAAFALLLSPILRYAHPPIQALAWADEILIPDLTLEDYTNRAIQEGIQGRKNAWMLEQEGYRREIAFRQTDSPTLSVGHTHTRGDTSVDHEHALSESQQTNLTLNEVTPLGTLVNATGQYGAGGGVNVIQNDSIGKPGVTANVTQPLYLFVKNSVMRSRRQADLNFANAKDTFNSTVLSLRTQARSLYYNVMLQDESIQVEEHKVAATRKLLEVTQALVKAGKSASVETMRAKIRLQTDQRTLDNATVSRDKALLSAKNYIYFPLDQPVHFTTKLEFKPFDITLDRLVQYAVLHQPQLSILRRDQELSKLSYEASLEPTRPTLSVNGTYGYHDDTALVAHRWSWTGTANWLFFDSFVTRDQVRSVRIDRWVADLNLADAERTIVVNIQSTYLDIKNAERQIREFTAQLNQAKHDVEVVRLRFQHGLDRLIDVFDASDQVESLNNEYLNLVVNYNRAKDNLSELIGADVESVP